MNIIFQCECNICHETMDAFFFGAPENESLQCIFCGTKKRVSRSMNALYESIIQLGGRIIGGYVNANTPVQCICSRGHICSPIPNNIHKGQGMCATCSGNNGMSAAKEFIENIKRLGGTVIGQYINCYTPVKCLCRYGHECSPQPGSIQAGQGMCRTCAGNDPEVARKIFEDNIKRHGGKVLGDYKNNHSIIECICLRGHKFLVYPHDARGTNDPCGICYQQYAEQNFIFDITNQGGTIVGEFINSNKSVNCVCKNGHQCYPFPYNVRRGQGMCCKCVESNGERMVAEALTSLGITFDKQVYMECIPKLRYDFSCLFEGRICYIEFDGEQHFEFIEFFHKDESGFQSDRQRDLLKTNVCIRSNIKLIRLHFNWCGKSIEELASYLQASLMSTDLLVADHVIHIGRGFMIFQVMKQLQSIKFKDYPTHLLDLCLL